MTSAHRFDDLQSEVPELHAGDRLTQAEFHRRYAAMERLEKAELIEGVVYMHSPVRAPRHGDPHFSMAGWLAVYVARTPGVVASDNATVILDADNEPQPDLSLRVVRGQSRLEDDYIVGAPELVAEVTASTASYDLHDKKHAYRRNGVSEYVVWRVEDGEVDWFVLREGRYARLARGTDAIYRSEVFPGLWLDDAALLRSDLLRVEEVARAGVGTSEHAGFVASLRSG